MSDIKKKYKFVENKDAKWQGIGLTKEAGFFQGVVYRYGKVTPIEEDDKLRLKFDYNVARNPNNVDTDNEKFVKIIGDILADNIEREVDNGTIGKNRKNSTS